MTRSKFSETQVVAILCQVEMGADRPPNRSLNADGPRAGAAPTAAERRLAPFR